MRATDKRWTDEEIEIIRREYKYGEIESLAKKLGRTKHAVQKKAHENGITCGRFLTKEQRELLTERGYRTNTYFAKKFGKPNHSIRKSRQIYASSVIDCNENKATCAEVGRMVGKCKSTIAKCWCGRHGLPYKMVGKYKMIRLSDLYEWMQAHPDKWDATKCEKWYFEKFEWFNMKRELDFQRMIDRRWNAS